MRASLHAIFTQVQIELYRMYSNYHFIANSTSYLNAAGFWDSFSAPIISKIVSIGSG